jgi:PAS domain S-box-containing protein
LSRSPFAIWASDRNCKIVYWSKQAEQVYGHKGQDAYGKDFVDLFVDLPEQQQARADCLTIIEQGTPWRNFLAFDQTCDGRRLTMLTNCFRVLDEKSGQFVQVEVGLDISDLDISREKHRTLRELGMAMLATQRRTVELERRELTLSLAGAYASKLRSLQDARRQIEGFMNTLTNERGSVIAEAMNAKMQNDHASKTKRLQEHFDLLSQEISRITTLELADLCRENIEDFDKDEEG